MSPTCWVVSSTGKELGGHFPSYLRQVFAELFGRAERIIVSGYEQAWHFDVVEMFNTLLVWIIGWVERIAK